MVSTKDSPRRLWLWSLVFWVLAISPSVLAQPNGSFAGSGPKAVTVTFHLQPSKATIWRRTVEGGVHRVGTSGEAITLGLNPSEASGDRKLIVEFRVKLLFGEWVSPPEFLDSQELLASNRYPGTGVRELGLSGWERFQLFVQTYLPVIIVAFAGLGIFGFQFWRGRGKAEERAVGLHIPNYALGSLLGEGGMGEVYRARHDDGTTAAVKVLRSMLSESKKYQEQFDKELHTYSELRHPNLLRLFGFGYTEDGRTYMATELLEGETLKERLEGGTGEGALAAEVLEQIGSALDYLHQAGIIHQDVKPGNIFLGEDGTVKLLDLGVARRIDATGKVSGTPAYMAPEQFEGEVTPFSDQYSLGLVIQEILVGKGPTEKQLPDGLKQMMSQEASGRFTDLKAAREVLTDELLKITL